MPSLACRNCDGSGYVRNDEGATVICDRCDGTGTVFVDDVADDVMIEV